ncbi:MAG: RNA methyltransferase [Mycobacterium sp.]|nr:RNA methyltransferase [Mycobacterium sp.]
MISGKPPMTPRSPRVAEAVKLLRRTERTAAGRFLAEGPNLVEAACRAGLVQAVFATEASVQRYRSILQGITVYTCTETAMTALSETVTPPGLVAVCTLPGTSVDEALAGNPALVAVGVGIADPGNAGTLIRLADAMGAGAVFFTGEAVDPYNGKCVRSSAGSIFDIPVLLAPDTDDLLRRLRTAGLQILATTVTGGDLSLDDADAVLSTPTAWLFGQESRGLPGDVAAQADRRVTIPMSGCAESLNVAIAAGICLYQSARARRLTGSGAQR